MRGAGDRRGALVRKKVLPAGRRVDFAAFLAYQ
jgi:hypothetical protein